jgi:hypothetical protein
MNALHPGNARPPTGDQTPRPPARPERAGRARVNATLTYMVKSAHKPYVHTAALTGGAPRYFAEMEPRSVAIRDGRAVAARLSLDREGFELRRQRTRVRDFRDDGEVESVYYPEIERLLTGITGASRVLIFDHTRRTDEGTHAAGFRGPASRVHNDYTAWSGPERVRALLGQEALAALNGNRVAQINVWRPMRSPVLRSPLALLDASSVAPEDLIATDHVYPDRVGEIYHLAYQRRHRWFYFPRMQRDEVVLIKGYDSREDGRARFTPHTAFTDPATPVDAPARESIEVRTLVLFG